MELVQTSWNKIKKMLKFIWRHCFTLADLSLSMDVLIFDTLNWKTALITLAIAITIDWAKQFIKFSPKAKSPFDDPFTPLIPPLHDQWWNSSIRGTPAYFMRNDDYYR